MGDLPGGAETIDLLRRCVYCGERVVWHRVYRTRAGVRAFCGVVPRSSESGPAVGLDDEAVDVWDRLHHKRIGVQGSLF